MLKRSVSEGDLKKLKERIEPVQKFQWFEEMQRRSKDLQVRELVWRLNHERYMVRQVQLKNMRIQERLKEAEKMRDLIVKGHKSHERDLEEEIKMLRKQNEVLRLPVCDQVRELASRINAEKMKTRKLDFKDNEIPWEENNVSQVSYEEFPKEAVQEKPNWEDPQWKNLSSDGYQKYQYKVKMSPPAWATNVDTALDPVQPTGWEDEEEMASQLLQRPWFKKIIEGSIAKYVKAMGERIWKLSQRLGEAEARINELEEQNQRVLAKIAEQWRKH
ncbi:uncharacterized protein [Pyrus communis]|uniref:uncharacterized protein n=1 Tax=Pyrus communis TaxID=23211 RepID=UPI0035C22D12